MFDLSNYLPYLLNRVGFAVTDRFGETLVQESLTVPMWRVLAVLLHDGSQRIGDLAELTSIEISTLSRLVGSMQRRGFLTRKRAQADARVVNVALTTRGRAITERLLPVAIALEETLVGPLPAGEVAELKRLLHMLHVNLAAEPARAATERSA